MDGLFKEEKRMYDAEHGDHDLITGGIAPLPGMRNNTSGLHPQGHAVLIQTYEPQLESKTIAIPESIQRNQHMVNQRAVVIEVGPNAWSDEKQPRAKPGDHVLVTKYAGFIAGADMTKDRKIYRLVTDREIFCTLES